MRFDKIIGGMASTARSIFYKPKDTSRAATNVQAELDKINDDVSDMNATLYDARSINNYHISEIGNVVVVTGASGTQGVAAGGKILDGLPVAAMTYLPVVLLNPSSGVSGIGYFNDGALFNSSQAVSNGQSVKYMFSYVRKLEE